MASIPETKDRLITLFKVLDFFENNPFEQSYCGMSKKNAITLVQLYLREQHQNISILPNIDFTSHIGKSFKNSYDSFLQSVQAAKSVISNNLEQVNEAERQGTTITTPNPLSQTLGDNSTADNVFQRFQHGVMSATGRDAKQGRKFQWVNGVLVRGLPGKEKWEKEKTTSINPETNKPFTSKEIIDFELSRILNEDLAKEREIEIKKELDERREKIAIDFGLTGALSQIDPTQQSITDVIDLPNPKEIEKWESFVFKNMDASGRKAEDFSQEAREREIKQFFIDELTSKGVTNAEEIVSRVNSSDLVRYSFLKFFQHTTSRNDLTEDQKQEKIGGLLAGKMFATAFQAVNAPHIDPAKKEKLVSATVIETYVELANQGFAFLQSPDQAISEKLKQNLEKKFKPRAVFGKRYPTTISQIAIDPEISLEAKELVSRQNQQAVNGQNQYHTLPIPGLLFLNSFQRSEIIGNSKLFKTLVETQNLERAAEKEYKPDNRLQMIENYLLAYKTGQYQMSREEVMKFEKEKQEIIDFKTKKTPISYETQRSALFDSIGLHPIDHKKGFSPEEIALATKFLQVWQGFAQKHRFAGKIIRFSASWQTMTPVWKGWSNTPILGIFAPNKYLMAHYIKAVVSTITGDPTQTPLMIGYLLKSMVTGSLALWAKGHIAHAFDRGFAKTLDHIPLLKHLKGFIFVRNTHGMVTLTFLHPIEAVKVLWEVKWRQLAQKVATKSLTWGARIMGKNIIGRMMAAGAPVIGSILGMFFLLWDFIFPEWLKKILKLIIGGIIIGLGWLIALIVGAVGPIAALGMLIGLLIGGPAGLVAGLILGSAAQIILWALTGNLSLLPFWLQGAAAAAGNTLSMLGQLLSGAAKGLSQAILPAVLPISQLAFVSVASIAGVGAAGFVSIMIITTAVWTPLAPGAVPGGLIAQDFMVKKYVLSNPSNACQSKTITDESGNHEVTTKCENDVTDPSKNVSFTYTIQIQVKDGVKISNIQMTDEITVVAQGPNITTPPTIFKHILQAPIDQAKVSAIVLPDPSTGGNVAEIKYAITLQDPKFQNSVVFNLVKVTANGQTASNGTAFTIGTPPPSDCPVKQGTINCGSLGGSFTGCQHGSDSYWCGADPDCTAANKKACYYPIPALTQTNGNSISYSNATKCVNSQPLRDDYGFALDIGPRDQMVFFPSIYGESLSWTLDGQEQGNPNTPKPGDPPPKYGWGGRFSAKGKDFSYKMYMTHLEQNFHHSGLSGEVIGPMFTNNPNGSHVHVELEKAPNNSTQWETLRPEFLCSY